MAAVVAPVCVEDAELGLVGVAVFGVEIFHHLHQVVAVHGQAHLLAVGRGLFGGDAPDFGEGLHGEGVGAFGKVEHVEVLAARLDGVDAVMSDLVELLGGDAVVEDHQFGGGDLHVGVGLQQAYALLGGGCALVELAGKSLDGKVGMGCEVHGVAHGVGGDFAEDSEAGAVEEFGGEAEEVVDHDEAELLYVEREVGVEFAAEAFGFHAEIGTLLYVDSVLVHRRDADVRFWIRFLFRVSCGPAPRGKLSSCDGARRR